MALTESDLTEFLRLLEGDETLQLDFARAFLKERVVRKLMAHVPDATGVLHGTTTGASGGERLGSLDTGRVWMP